MPVYQLDTQTVRTKQPNSVANFVVLAAVYFTVRIAFDLVGPSGGGREDILRLVPSGVLWGVVCASFTMLYAKMQLRRYELWLNDSTLRVKSTWFDRSVHRGEIRTTVERRDGLLISSRGKVGMFLWGGVLISRMLPEYEQLKALAETWKVSAENGGSDAALSS